MVLAIVEILLFLDINFDKIKMMNEYRIQKVSRCAITGQFVSIKEARRRPKTTIIQNIKIPLKK